MAFLKRSIFYFRLPRHFELSPQFKQFSSICSKSDVKKVHARQIFDSRGYPTVEVEICTAQGLFRASVPSGASTGKYEAVELRDKDPKSYHGKGVLKAVRNVNQSLAPIMLKEEIDVTHQECIDNLLIHCDGSENKSKFGANAILGISMAICRAGAGKKKVPLYQHIADLACTKQVIVPMPAFNVINGGSHAGNKLAMQEFMILPTGAYCFADSMKVSTEIYHHLKQVIRDKYGLADTSVGDEGGFAPNISSHDEALQLIMDAIAKSGHKEKVEIGMDVAASEFFKDGKYDLDFKNPKSDKTKTMTGEKLNDIYLEMEKKYPIASIEDPFDQDDLCSWCNITGKTKVQIVADDLTVTNLRRLEMAIKNKAANCLLLKLNQIGTVTEAIKAHQLAKESGWGTMVSHRSGETEDTFIADLAIGIAAGQIKSGAPCRSSRLAKYNQILRIEEQLKLTKEGAVFAGKCYRDPRKCLK